MVRAMPSLRITILAVLLTLAGTAVTAGTASAGDNVVMVELFTSQGCSSCPPADRTLAELADRDDILALSLHVDYWDYLGWQDTFAQAEHTERQAEYRDKLGARVLFTPQVVVDGFLSVAGYKRAAIEKAIERAARDGHPLGIAIHSENGMLRADITGSRGRDPCTIWVAAYDQSATVEIDRGENAGNTFVYHNVVDKLMKVGPWDGQAGTSFPLPQPGPGEGIAVWLQDDRSGRILAASYVED
jgi:hypothetical protein